MLALLTVVVVWEVARQVRIVERRGGLSSVAGRYTPRLLEGSAVRAGTFIPRHEGTGCARALPRELLAADHLIAKCGPAVAPPDAVAAHGFPPVRLRGG